jgi:tetratricopeptide (TPR) repeat protein
VEEILHQAERLEKEYDWLGATELHEKALNLLPQDDFSKMGEIHERLGYALYRFSFQAENKDEFRERLRQSAVACEKAVEFYGKLNEPVKTPRTSRCNAMIAYIGYWLASEAKEKKKMIDECWRLTEEALAAFKEAGEGWEYGKTHNQLSSSIVFGFCLEWNFQAREKVIREAVEYGEQTIKFLSSIECPCELARAYARTAFYLGVFADSFLDADEKETGCQKARDYWARAKEISENVALSEVTWPILGPTEVLLGEAATDEALKNLGEALEYGKRTKDKFNIGCALDWLAYHTAWKTKTTEDPDERLALTETALQYAEDAKRHYFPTSFISPRTDNWWVEAVDADHLRFLASRETDVKKKQALLEKAITAAREGLKRAESSGYIEAIIYEHHVSSYTLELMAELEKRTQEKKAILQEAMKHREETVRMTEKIQPFGYWNRGAMQAGMARIKYKLAELAKGTPEEKNMVQEAVLDLENALRLGTTEVSLVSESAPPLHSELGGSQYRLGVWLGRLYEITNDRECLRKAVKAFDDAVEAYQKINSRSRVAECQWKAATTYDVLGEHLKAAENFALASNSYKNAVEKIPQLKSLYQDHASYMLAWTEIEKARHHHERQEHGSAKEHFEKAAELHKSLKQWNYLEPNYFAWAQVENAEELSRKERIEEAINAFKQADNLFNEAKRSLEAQLSKIEDSDEKQMAADLVKATGVRQEYCMGRIALEQARKMDKEGDHYSSSEKYGSAAEAFEKTSESAESDQERREIRFTINLSRAWQKMTLAEAKSSPALYMEASQLFEQTEELSPNEKTKMLVLGHSRFCRALEAGTKYVDTRDPAMHVAAVQHLASASNYYIRADFPNASEYAKATKLLFDAYAYMDNAERESDPDKKAKLYTMVEKVLQTSAGSFTKAEHPEKREQVLKLLEKAREERELATSLTEVLHAPSIVSTTRVLTAPTPTHEEAVGSERFEHADVQANLIIRQKELKIGENLNIELELVNAGKGSALLTKVTEIIPKGFELAEEPENCRVEDSYLNLKGKRLDPLKTEEVKIVLKPTVQGTFSLKPTVLYLDENGKYKSHEPEPVMIIVKELGIKGWLKGER